MTIFAMCLILFASRRGLLGVKVTHLVEQYGDNVFALLFRARPEFPFSIQILKQLPFFGFGTVSDPFNHVHLNIVYSSTLSFQEQHFLLNRILSSGFNLHSWCFDLVARAGFLSFIPILIYAAFLIRSIFSYNLISKYPGLTYICIVSLEDLFFSPYSWFVSIQIALSFVAIYLAKESAIPDHGSRIIVKT
jgi:hypothetical protein